jgi:hypothetical protein
MKRITGILLAAVLTGCGEKQSKVHDTPPRLSNRIDGTWPPAPSANVTGYRFKTNPAEEPFSCIVRDQRRIDLGELEKRAGASAKLSGEKTAELLDATFQKNGGLPPAACYEPHHIFLFRGSTGEITHAIEICFDCNDVYTLPPLPDDQGQHHDFRRLYKLCDSLGLTEKPAEEFYRNRY